MNYEYILLYSAEILVTKFTIFRYIRTAYTKIRVSICNSNVKTFEKIRLDLST